ncbi:MAG: 6-oxocyclohex-1-ene-1-carbonyl-CoA hydratase [Acidobacteriota bacterium]
MTAHERELLDHRLPAPEPTEKLRVEERPVLDADGTPAAGLHNVWIWLDNPRQLNSYTTEMLKSLIAALRNASLDRAAVCVVLTATGTRSFCTGGNTKEYSEYYAGRPQEYRQYMRLFNDLVTALLTCDKPVINRVNGMRLAGGQEIGMASDFSIAADTAVFGQAGPKHGSAPDGGSTDFLPLFVGVERAMQSCTLCQVWSAHRALAYGLIGGIAPAYRLDGRWMANPLVVTGQTADDLGRPCLGEFKEGEEMEEGRRLVEKARIDLSRLDEAVESLATQLLLTMPGCLTKTIESVRKHKLAHWDRNRETNRAWLALNMAGEGKAGFRAFHRGDKGERQVDFVKLRRLLAMGHAWDAELIEAILPPAARRGGKAAS